MIKVIIYYKYMKTLDISDIDEMLPDLPEERIKEVRHYIGYLIEKERKRKGFEERILKIERESDTIECHSVEEAMQAILNAPDDDEEKG
jgi:hypothetical protein